MAAVPPPNRTRFVPSTELDDKGVEMPAVPVPGNLGKSDKDTQDMNFKMDPAFHREFKLSAVKRGMKMNELLRAAFYHYERDFPAQ